MQQINDELILRKDDYDVINAYLRGIGRSSFDNHNAKELEVELRKAKLVDKDEFPGDVVRLNSKVTVREENANKEMIIMLVTPEKADIRQKRVSIMSPVGIALIGFRKGQKVLWNTPSGQKIFTIMDVSN